MERICVYCGSRTGDDPAYVAAAEAFGRELLARDLGLVYGGAGVGMMGAVADAVVAGGGETVGVIPESIAEHEQAHEGLTELRVVGSMHERKRTMADLADGFVALPGGLGTLEELFEVLTWAQLGIHDHPCGLLNVGGFYDHVLAHVDGATDAGFVAPAHRDLLTVAESPGALLDAFADYEPPGVEQVIDEGDT